MPEITIRNRPLRELQIVVNIIPSLLKALPIMVAWIVLLRFAIGAIKSWRQPMGGQEMAYALAGIAAFLWAIGR